MEDVCVQVTTPTKKNQQCLTGSVFTTTPIEVPPVNQVATPIWIRLPKVGKSCPYTGLSRATLNNLILGENPPVQSVSLRMKRHAIRGTRLILLSSLLEYIAGVATAQNPTNSAAAHAVVEEVDQQNKTAPSVTVQKTRRSVKKPKATK